MSGVSWKMSRDRYILVTTHVIVINHVFASVVLCKCNEKDLRGGGGLGEASGVGGSTTR